MSVLRSDLVCPIFGHGRDLPPASLPTYEDVLLCYLLISRNKKTQYKDLVSDTCIEVSQKLIEQWKLASIPVIDHRAIVKRLKAYHNKYRNLLKPYASRKDVKTYQERVGMFKEEAKCLFDIASCKCKSFDSCNCEKSNKIPLKERDFLLDQRTNRNTDYLSRKRQQEVYQEKHRAESLPVISVSVRSEVLCAPSTSKLLEVPHEPEIAQKFQKLNDLSAIAKTLDRFGVSDRAGAAIVSATLQNVGLISEDNLSNVVDRNKIRRARQKQRTDLTEAPLTFEGDNFGLYFDGRKDKTLTMEESRRKTIVQEHISLLKEPGSEYMGHISLTSGKATIISQNIAEFLETKNIDCDKLIVVGCDGTVVNTGSKGGVIRCLERKLRKPLQWCICQLHANELPLRHLFEHLDGTTTGPQSFTGPIGKALKDCEQLPLVPFESINCTLPDVTNNKDLSTDQLYLYDMCEAISSGSCAENLSKKNPGKMVHSRWLTTGNRILRLYVSSLEPTENLLLLVNFILRVYAPMWFTIKTRPLCIYGAKHLHQTIRLSRYLPDQLKAIIDPVIQRNGFFGHAENILIAMLADESDTVRVLALRRILKAQQATPCIRTFQLPKFNFDAENYIDLINWIEVTVTEPPLTRFLNQNDILLCIENPRLVDDLILSRISNFPCHTQATERCVKIVTESAKAVCGPERRDGFIKATLHSRKIMPVFNTKKEYRPL